MLARRSLLIYANNVLGAAMGMVALYFIGRYLTPTAVGYVSFASGIAAFAIMGSALGFGSAHHKRVSEGEDLGDCIRTYAVVRLTLTAAAVVVLAGLAWGWSRFRGFQDSTTLPVVLVLAAYVGIMGLRSVPTDTFLGRQQIAKLQTVVLVENVVKVVATVFVSMAVAFLATNGAEFGFMRTFIAQDLPYSVERAAFAYALVLPVTALSGLLTGAVLFRRTLRRPGRFRRDLFRRYVTFAVPLAIVAPLATMSSEVDVLTIGFFWSARDVGHYFAAKRILSLISIVYAAVVAIFFPLVSEMVARKEMVAVRATTTTAMRNISLFMAPIIAMVLVYAEAGLNVALGPRFVEGADILRVMVIGSAFTAGFLLHTAILQGFDRPWLATRSDLILIATNVVLNLLFVPTSIKGVPLLGMGATGAAVATVFATVVALAYLLWNRPAALHGTIPVRSIAKHLGVATVMGAGLWALPDLPGMGAIDRFYELAVVGVLGTALYIGLLVALRELGAKDWLLVKDLLNVTRMRNYVSDEMDTE